MTRRIRVLVLGGGCGGVAAAEELTATAERRRRFEVTLLSAGHRLGGKGATGRDPRRAQRVEEHGLHVWMGFYARSFRMMRRAFEEWRAPAGAPFTTLEQAFTPHDRSIGIGPDAAASGGLDRWSVRFPPRPGRPWDDDAERVDWRSFGRELLRFGVQGARDVARAAAGEGPDVRRRLAILSRLALAASRGLLLEVLPHGEAGFDRIDGEDLRAWLVRHGASPDDVAGAPLVRGVYDLAFAYPDGVAGPGRGAVAAGAALESVLLITLGYRGAPFWRMRLGMGDTVFAPLHGVLGARGVRVELFHRVQRLGLDAAGRVARVHVARQARARAERYEPLVTVRGQPAWPSEPRWEQLEEGDALAASGVDLEASAGPAARPIELERGRDFDDVVLAVPSPAQRAIAEELCARSERYRAMLDATPGVATIAAQLWLRRSTAELGFAGPPPLLTGAPGLFSSWGDMTEVGPSEAWSSPPASIAYFCDVCPPGLLGLDPAEGRSRLAAEARAWADSELTRLWPGARDPHGRFRHDLLLAPDGATDPWLAQYFRVNDAPSERYVLSLPGTTAARLAPDESGFENLFLAGDWTRTRINGGSVEAAVESGQGAATAICRRHGIG